MATIPASAQVPLRKGDTVGIIGNALADRMQHEPPISPLSGTAQRLIQGPPAKSK